MLRILSLSGIDNHTGAAALQNGAVRIVLSSRENDLSRFNRMIFLQKSQGAN